LRGRVALRLFDGISQTTPLREGSRNGTFTDMDIVAQIEVINGPSASEGIGAAGGIINYISKSPTKDGSEATLRTKFFGQGYEDSMGYKVGLNYTVKKGANDLIFGTSFLKRGIFWDAHGRRMGQSGSGTTHDSDQKNLFIKAGHNFGENNSQRLTLTVSKFKIEGRGHYVEDPGNSALGITSSSKRGTPPGGKSVFNDFSQYILAYNNSALFGGKLNIIGYKASQAMRFVAERAGVDKWDPQYGPIESFFEQSEINSQKRGVRSNWSRENLFAVEGLEMNAGFDYMYETAQQRLAITDRLWVPPMNYTSKAPFVQASYARGPVTVSAGVRHEDGSLQVDDYTTVYFANNTFVRGGTLPYKENMPNVGVIVRLPQGWSAFGSYSKGFTLPNVGIPLRNVNKPGQTVEGILDLQAVVFDNKEVGVSWQGKKGSFGVSYYKSYSELGASLTSVLLGTPPNQTLDFILQRRPVDIKGLEFTGELKLSKTLKFTAVYAHLTGMTRTGETGPLNRELGISNITPDKLNLATTWKFMPKASVTLEMDKLFKRDVNIGNPAGGAESTRGLTLFHLTASYSTKWGDFSLGVENLVNKFYILPYVQAGQVLGGDLAGRGRVFSVTHAIKF
jgi:iron complex outermembrane receptor protein